MEQFQSKNTSYRQPSEVPSNFFTKTYNSKNTSEQPFWTGRSPEQEGWAVQKAALKFTKWRTYMNKQTEAQNDGQAPTVIQLFLKGDAFRLKYRGKA